MGSSAVKPNAASSAHSLMSNWWSRILRNGKVTNFPGKICTGRLKWPLVGLNT